MRKSLTVLTVLLVANVFANETYGEEASRVTWQPSSSGSCENCNLFGRQMPFWDLTEAHYDGANVSYASLHGVQANGAFFNDITGKYADFSRAQANNAQFGNAVMHSARLSGIIANGANFSGATLDQSDMREAQLVGANFVGVSALQILGGAADFSAANASQAVFDGAILRGAIFTGALLTGTSFIGSDLAGASFRDARLAGADFTNATGTEQGNFTGACISELTRLPAGVILRNCAQSATYITLKETPQ